MYQNLYQQNLKLFKQSLETTRDMYDKFHKTSQEISDNWRKESKALGEEIKGLKVGFLPAFSPFGLITDYSMLQ